MNRNASITATFVVLTFSLNAWAQGRAPAPPRPQPVPDVTGRPGTPAEVAPRVIPNPLPQPVLASGFGTPEGLMTPAEVLLPGLGFGPADCFPLTPVSCFEVGYKCYCRGLFRDALAFTDHGLKLSNHARLYLLKAVCEMHLGLADQATSTIEKYRIACVIPQETIGLFAARERINDPMRVRMEYLLAVPE